MCGSNKAEKAAKRAAEEARQREAQRQARLATGRTKIDEAFVGFDDPYYETRSKAYIDFASPQLEEQFADTKKKLTFALSRGGLLNSTSAAQKTRELQEQYDRNKQLIASRGADYATNARKEVSDNRARLLSTLSSTEDPDTVANEAVRSAATLRQQPSFDVLGNLFTDFGDTISSVNNARQIGQAFSSGVRIIPNRGSGRVVS